MSQQGARQADVRASTGTTYDYNGDWMALFDQAGIAVGDFDGRLLAWINAHLGTGYTEVNGAMQAFAEAQGAFNWSSLGTVPTFVPTAIAGADFANGRYRNGAGSGYSTNFAGLAGVSVVRSSIKTATKLDGTMLQFAANVAAITDQGFLPEASRTNLLTQANDGSKWGSVRGVTRTPNGDTYGPMTGYRFASGGDSTGETYPGVNAASIAATVGSIYSLTLYYAAGTSPSIALSLLESGGSGTNFFTGPPGALTRSFGTGNMAVVSDAVVFGSIRKLVFRWTIGTGTTAVAIAVRPNSSVVGQDVVLYGSQFELGADATSFIPTTTATATRAADQVSLGALSVTPAATVVATFAGSAVSANVPAYFTLDDGTVNNNISLDCSNATTTQTALRAQIRANNAVVAGAPDTNVATVAIGSINRAAMAVDQSTGRIRVAVNGVMQSWGADSGLTITAATYSRLNIGWNPDFVNETMNGYIQKVIVYPTALSNAQLQALSA